ncbi:MAG: 23S rRNA (guanosine(2251)-2'-O)-methyltransferase RlmB [Deltaproteobacteria bacterium]|nr:23S rRNA (guanosine(2251)-2'-O)-methyltransferase RlmB [Deltaproteobacteria bacterium]
MKRIIAGPNAVEEAIRARVSIHILYVQSGLTQKTAARLFSLASKYSVKTQSASKEHLAHLAGTLNHQGVVAVCGDYQYADLDDLIERLSNTVANPLLLLLDQIQDPGNLGAILRSAHSLGAHGVIITRDRSAQMTPAAVRSSAGASELIPVSRVVNLVATIQKLQQNGFEVFGTAMNAPHSVDTLQWPSKTAIVLGNEGKGIRKLTSENCDVLFHIPMVGDFESLNVSAAAAIVLYEFQRITSGR